MPPDPPKDVDMVDIRTITYTPTSGHKGRKHLAGAGGGKAGLGGQSPCCDNAAGGAAATPRLSGGGGGGDGDDDITLKLLDFGGTEDVHAVHGLFFSG